MYEQRPICPKVYIIIINWNGIIDTLESLASLCKLNYSNYEIIVINNGFSDNSVDIIKERHSNVIIIESQTNLGFTGGNNLGIRFALENNADYVWLLNNDTIVDSEALAHLVRAASMSRDNGIIGSVIYDYADNNKIQFAGATIDWVKGVSPHTHTLHHNSMFEVERVNGCSMLVSRDVCTSIGLFDENYFLYAEEVDWCVRARNAKFKCLMEPMSKIYHKGSATVNKAAGKGIIVKYYNTRNFLYLIDKLCPYYWRKLIIAKLILKYVRRDKRNFIKMLLSGIFRLKLVRPEDSPKLFAAKDYLFNNMGRTLFIKNHPSTG
jgi:GT2 family glycosyltransferase